jgi:secreted Zn-dependent insulinase-like peptidase
VGVGSLLDKDRSLGLAHFLEHMLFMGSKKYPLHNDYGTFISANSGNDNAYTDEMETNYYFGIKNSAFYEAVERFTNFFTGDALLLP